jgi:peroxiredoxin
MVKTASTMLPLGTRAPDFSLPGTDGRMISRAQFAGQPLCVVFMCNHCPFVVHIRSALAQFASEYAARGVAVVGISSNFVGSHPQDGPEQMRLESVSADETQAVAMSYRAACTPDFFLIDRDHDLVYRGQFDGSRPGNGVPVTGTDLRAACDAVLGGLEVSVEQRASIGCNIKWKPGSEPGYYTGVAAG